jgi:hypothetical protein
MNIELWAIDKPIAYARNARTIPQAAIDKVAASIREFGWQQPIVVDTDGVVVAGHVRLLAAKQLGEKQVPVQIASGLTAGQIKAYRLLDNRSHQESGWDMEMLAPEIAELQGLNIDTALTGFDPDEISKFLDSGTSDGEPPESFKEFDENIPTDHQCPKCGYRWSGQGSSAAQTTTMQDAAD